MTYFRSTVRSHCNHGHPWIPDNIGLRSDGFTFCKLCKREANLRYSRNHRGSTLPIRARKALVIAGERPWTQDLEYGRAIHAKYEARRQAEFTEKLSAYRERLQEMEAA